MSHENHIKPKMFHEKSYQKSLCVMCIPNITEQEKTKNNQRYIFNRFISESAL